MLKGDKFILNTYEYKLIDHIPDDKELSRFGSEGWELVAILNLNPQVNSIIYYFKRKKGELMTIAEN